MIVRQAEVGDLDHLCAMYESFYQYFSGLEPYIYRASTANRSYYSAALHKETEVFFAAFDNETPIGFCHVSEKSSAPTEFYVKHKFAVLMEIYVTEAYRHTNISEHLMAKAKQWTKDRQLDYIELRVLDLDNYAHKLYEQEGFDIVSHTMRCPMK